jgi:thioesterase domain-containing protein
MKRFNPRPGRLPGERTAYEMSVRLQAVGKTVFPVGLLDTIAPDFIQELRVPDDEIWSRPAAQRAQAREAVFPPAPRPPHAPAPDHRVPRAADPSQAREVAR